MAKRMHCVATCLDCSSIRVGAKGRITAAVCRGGAVVPVDAAAPAGDGVVAVMDSDEGDIDNVD